MSELEVMTLVDSKPTTGMIVLRYVLIALTALCIGLMLLVPTFFMVPSIVMAAISYVVISGQKIEYEYTYYDGELKIAKIKDKRKRKELVQAEMSEVVVLAPEGDDALRAFNGQNPNERMRVLDYSSHVKGRDRYVLVYRRDTGKSNELCKVFFEPEDKIVNGMRSREMRKVVLRK